MGGIKNGQMDTPMVVQWLNLSHFEEKNPSLKKILERSNFTKMFLN